MLIASTGAEPADVVRFSSRSSRVVVAARCAPRAGTEAQRLTGAVAFPRDITEREQVTRSLEFVEAEHLDLDTALLDAG
ncbi:hypothetical protein [Umezawaea beigongshangensis]|uniref:hypothetical protein n=1 Tax=Umezawaea beigongshangensis TaxID=2780383 RepID=UPI0018F238B8|nr:hypothetical protein [Umezawaea beigongshangensis]